MKLVDKVGKEITEGCKILVKGEKKVKVVTVNQDGELMLGLVKVKAYRSSYLKVV